MFNKRNMNKRHSLNVMEAICLVVALYIICCVLGGDYMPISISSVWSSLTLSHWARHWHVLAAGLLPVYVALMVFGTAIASLYFGSALHRWLKQFIHFR